jgi:uncharacterized protein YacL
VIIVMALWTLRALSAVGVGVLGWRLGLLILELSFDTQQFIPWGLAFTLAGVVLGGASAPYIILKPWRASVEYISSLPGPNLAAAIVGLLVGLIIASLVSIPLYTIDGWPGWAVPILISVVLGGIGLWLGTQRQWDMRAVLPALEPPASSNNHLPATRNGSILVDTSAIIDGRIADVSITGFLEGSLLVPRFVLDELRHIADSSDPLRRNRGRRGLEVLARLRKDGIVPLQCSTWESTVWRWTPGWCSWPAPWSRPFLPPTTI